MQKWYPEDWHFELKVLRVGRENKAEECRVGLEPGDTFRCSFETPNGFCPTAFIKIFPAMEVVRCNGDLTQLGGEEPTKIKFSCPDDAVIFELIGTKVS